MKLTPRTMISPEPVTIPRIETDRLWLRPWDGSDTTDYARIVQDPEVMRYMGCGLRFRAKRAASFVLALISEFESRRAIRQFTRHWQECAFGEWAVEEKASGKLIGQIGLRHHPDWIADTAKVEIGWLLARHAWGHGFATEGAKASLAFAFEHVRLKRIVSITRSDNLRSRHVMRRIGLSPVGTTHWKGCEMVWSAMDRTTWEREYGRGNGSPIPSPDLRQSGDQRG